MSEQTEMFENKYPLAKVIVDYVWKRLEVLVAVSLMGVGTSIYNKHADHQQIWTETGDHFQDLLKTNNVQEQELQNLRERIMQLEKGKQ